MNAYQQRILDFLIKCREKGWVGITTCDVCNALRSTIGPVSSSLRALERQGLVGSYYPSWDQSRWARRRWCVIDKPSSTRETSQ